MKILNRQQINEEKSRLRKIEIDEGIKLAEKIDLLRETAAKEESKLKKFRDENLKIIQKEINELIDKRNKLLDEIKNLEHGKRIT